MVQVLNRINSTADLKSLSPGELNALAHEIRGLLIKTISNTGGHLASNLGVVELTVALHYHLNSPEDKIIWDVGHQSYTHKILTGRKDQIATIRQYGGLSGYPKRQESIHDIMEGGHTSTSISSALGLAISRDLAKENYKIYSVIGDGALTGGLAFEALNNAGHLQKNIKVILNDNEMSISPNVGALSHYLSKLRTTPSVNRLKEDIEFLINSIPRIGTTVSKTVERVKNGLKYVFLSGILFEEMGFTYIGPLDGHNITELVNNFNKADLIDGPVIIHVNTKKGKGYKPAERMPAKYHGVSPFLIKNGESKSSRVNPTYSQIFGQTLATLGENDKKIVGITAAMPRGTGLSIFQDRFPERTFDVGIAEQHAMELGAGLTRGGMKPVVALYSTFLQRAYDQVLNDIGIQKLPVTIAIDRAGIVGSDGETHQGVFDFSFLRPIPNFVIMAPSNENDLQHMLYTAIEYKEGPAALRYPRGEGTGVKLDKVMKKIPIGKAKLVKEGEDILLLAIGTMVNPASQAADKLENEGISAEVINARFLKPLDEDLIIKEISKFNRVITIEEQALAGGFGSAILELVNKNEIEGVSIRRIGLPDEFITHGKADKMREKYGLDQSGIMRVVREMMDSKLKEVQV